MRRIVLTGSECTGKTTTARAVAAANGSTVVGIDPTVNQIVEARRRAGGAFGDFEDLGHVQVSLGRSHAVEREGLISELHEQRIRVWICVDGHAADAGIPCGANHPNGDLPAVGYQHFGNRHWLSSPGLRRHRSGV